MLLLHFYCMPYLGYGATNLDLVKVCHVCCDNDMSGEVICLNFYEVCSLPAQSAESSSQSLSKASPLPSPSLAYPSQQSRLNLVCWRGPGGQRGSGPACQVQPGTG